MANSLSGVSSPQTIDPSQVTVTPSAPRASDSSSDGFAAALDRARGSDDSSSSDAQTSKSTDTSSAPSAKTKKSDKSKSKKSPKTSTKAAKKPDPVQVAQAKPAVKPTKPTDADTQDADPQHHPDGPPSPEEEIEQKAVAQNAANAQASAQASAAAVAVSTPHPVAQPKLLPGTASLNTAASAKLTTAAKATQKVAEPSDADKDTDAEGNALSSDSKDSDATTKADKPHAAPAAATGLKPTSSTTNDPSTSTANAVAATDQSASLHTMAAMDDGDSDDTAAAVTGVPTLTADDTAAAAQLAGVATPASATASGTTATKTAAAPPLPARTNFVATNEPSIVKAVKTELLPTGGTMQMRLDPPELGVLQVSVHVKDGVVSASFQTSNDEATKLLSHSMGQLKTALESQGVTIGKMHVQQTPKEQATSNQNSKEDSGSSSQSREGSSSRQDEQRREALKRMWERLSLGSDPLDLVA